MTCLWRNDNIDAVHEGLLRLVLWRMASLKHGEHLKQLTLDIDGLPIDVHGHQGGSAFHKCWPPLLKGLPKLTTRS